MTRLDFPGPGTLVRHEIVARERALAPRAVDVWLPPDHIPGTRRSALYCADGQNLFRPVDSFAGVPWSLHTAALTAAAVTGRPTPVVVGVWNVGEGRYHEYLPPEPELRPSGAGEAHLALARAHGRRPDADAYLRLLADEVVPLVEGSHGIMTAATDRAAHGSSMGGVVALYAALTRPDVFGGAVCVSTDLIVGGDPLVDWFASILPGPGETRLWFDRGTEGLDAEYGATQDRLDAALRASGLLEGQDWVSRVYPGAEHSEGSWAARAGEALAFWLARA